MTDIYDSIITCKFEDTEFVDCFSARDFGNVLLEKKSARRYTSSFCRELAMGDLQSDIMMVSSFNKIMSCNKSIDIFYTGYTKFDADLDSVLHKTLNGMQRKYYNVIKSDDETYGLNIETYAACTPYISLLLLIYRDKYSKLSTNEIITSILRSRNDRWGKQRLQQLFTAYYLCKMKYDPTASLYWYNGMWSNGPGNFVLNNNIFFNDPVFDAFCYIFKDDIKPILQAVVSESGLSVCYETRIIDYITSIKVDPDRNRYVHIILDGG